MPHFPPFNKEFTIPAIVWEVIKRNPYTMSKVECLEE